MNTRARIDLSDTADGGLAEAMSSPCQSFLLRVEHDLADQEPVDLGVRITTASGAPLVPGTAGIAVELEFWSDLAEEFVMPGARFTLRYPSRVVGVGEILDAAPF